MTRIDRIFSDRLGSKVLLRFQDPVYLSEVSEPEPDVAVVAMDPLDYEEQHPRPNDIFLLIEVADTTVKRDREIFDSILSQAVHSKYIPELYESPQAWKLLLKTSDVRLQWDPDHSPGGERLGRRAIQLGWRGEVHSGVRATS